MKNIMKLTATAAAFALAGCATVPAGPSVLVLQGSSKSFEQFSQDNLYCRDYSLRQVSGKAPGQAGQDAAVRSAVVGTVIGAAAGAALGGNHGAGVGAGTGLLFGSMAGSQENRHSAYSIQQQYDNAYIQCMYGAGHRVPVPAGLRSIEASRPQISAPSMPPPTTQPPPPPPPTR